MNAQHTLCVRLRCAKRWKRPDLTIFTILSLSEAKMRVGVCPRMFSKGPGQVRETLSSEGVVAGDIFQPLECYETHKFGAWRNR
eukprot:12892017-Prorocentrum_lima.AAC.1